MKLPLVNVDPLTPTTIQIELRKDPVVEIKKIPWAELNPRKSQRWLKTNLTVHFLPFSILLVLLPILHFRLLGEFFFQFGSSVIANQSIQREIAKNKDKMLTV